MDHIIVKTDLQGKPAIFVTDSIKNDQLLCWNSKGTNLESVSLAYYHSTKNMNIDKTESLVREYQDSFGAKEVLVRQRLPRNYSKPAMSIEGELNMDKLVAKIERLVMKYQTIH